MVSRRRAAACSCLVVAGLLETVQAFYLPGVAPTNFVEGQRVELKVRAPRKKGSDVGRSNGHCHPNLYTVALVDGRHESNVVGDAREFLALGGPRLGRPCPDPGPSPCASCSSLRIPSLILEDHDFCPQGQRRTRSCLNTPKPSSGLGPTPLEPTDRGDAEEPLISGVKYHLLTS